MICDAPPQACQSASTALPVTPPLTARAVWDAPLVELTMPAPPVAPCVPLARSPTCPLKSPALRVRWVDSPSVMEPAVIPAPPASSSMAVTYISIYTRDTHMWGSYPLPFAVIQCLVSGVRLPTSCPSLVALCVDGALTGPSSLPMQAPVTNAVLARLASIAAPPVAPACSRRSLARLHAYSAVLAP